MNKIVFITPAAELAARLSGLDAAQSVLDAAVAKRRGDLAPKPEPVSRYRDAAKIGAYMDQNIYLLPATGQYWVMNTGVHETVAEAREYIDRYWMRVELDAIDHDWE